MMKNLLKVLGTTAIAAVIGFSLIACGGNGNDLTNGGITGDPALTGTVTIALTAGGANVTTDLELPPAAEDHVLLAQTGGLSAGTGALSYQWYIDGVAIDDSRAWTSGFTITDEDTGLITVRVTRAGHTGSVVSAPGVYVQDSESTSLTGDVSITSSNINNIVGSTLTANTGDLDGTGTLFFQWWRVDGSTTTILLGQTGPTYTVVAADIDNYVYVRVMRQGYYGYEDASLGIYEPPFNNFALPTGQVYEFDWEEENFDYFTDAADIYYDSHMVGAIAAGGNFAPGSNFLPVPAIGDRMTAQEFIAYMYEDGEGLILTLSAMTGAFYVIYDFEFTVSTDDVYRLHRANQDIDIDNGVMTVTMSQGIFLFTSEAVTLSWAAQSLDPGEDEDYYFNFAAGSIELDRGWNAIYIDMEVKADWDDEAGEEGEGDFVVDTATGTLSGTPPEGIRWIAD